MCCELPLNVSEICTGHSHLVIPRVVPVDLHCHLSWERFVPVLELLGKLELCPVISNRKALLKYPVM